MKHAIPILAICVGTLLVAAGCSKSDNPLQPDVAQRSPSAQETPPSPVPRLPDPVVPKSAEAPSPMPGQAGDTSNPAFKDGGKVDPHK
jgi:hypothetical protein